MSEEPQLRRLVAGVRDVLGDDLVGAYLHGSAVLGGLQPLSDLDVIVVVTRRPALAEKQALVDLLLSLSARAGSSGSARPIEFDLVVQAEIRPWRYPPPFDFHFSELWRERFESGELEPWPGETNRDLASVVTMALLGDAPLFGPPAAEVFDPVPRRDYVDAILRDVANADRYLDWDTRNVVLTLPRIWSAIATDEVHSKESAARWALPRLPEARRPILRRALAVYLGEEPDRWDDLRPALRAYVEHVVGEIERARRATSCRPRTTRAR